MGSVTLFARIDPEAGAVVDRVAIRLGISKAEFVETLMFHVATTLDGDDVPTWWTGHVPKPDELDLHAS